MRTTAHLLNDVTIYRPRVCWLLDMENIHQRWTTILSLVGEDDFIVFGVTCFCDDELSYPRDNLYVHKVAAGSQSLDKALLHLHDALLSFGVLPIIVSEDKGYERQCIIRVSPILHTTVNVVRYKDVGPILNKFLKGVSLPWTLVLGRS